jgi:hypothetical protein
MPNRSRMSLSSIHKFGGKALFGQCGDDGLCLGRIGQLETEIDACCARRCAAEHAVMAYIEDIAPVAADYRRNAPERSGGCCQSKWTP